MQDSGELYELFTHAAEFKHQLDDHSWQDGFSAEGVKWILYQGMTYVALQADKIVGTTALEWSDKDWGELEQGDAGYIRRLAVAEEVHGQGIGRFILDWAMEEVKSKDRKYLRLDCAQNNTSLCKYYENQGFTLVKSVKWPSDTGKETTANLYQKEV